MKMISNHEQTTYDIGYKIGTLLDRGDVVCLTGDLGAGKTTMAKGIARGLGVQEDVTSPTFTIIHEYEGRFPLYHFDVYRIQHVEEMEDLGYEEYFYGEGVCIIEWASQIEALLPKERLWIDIKKGNDANARMIEIIGTSVHFDQLMEELKRK